MAPRRRVMSLSLCVAGVGGGARGTDARRHGGSMLQKLTKLDAMASCHPFIHLLVTIKPTIVFLGKCQQNRRGAGSPPSSWDLDGGWGGGAAPRSFDHQIRAHGQIHCHVSAMSASSVQIIDGELQVSRPAWCPPPPLTLVAPQACGPPATRPNHCLNKCHYVPKLIHSQADSFTGEFHPSRGLCGYALLLSSGNVPVTGALPDPLPRKQVDLQRRGPIIV